MKRVFVIVLDSLGIGELPDAVKYGDKGSNTLKSLYNSNILKIPNLSKMGIFNIDGNDYWVLNAIECIKPRIVICEYNGVFGPDKKVTVPYDEEFFRTSISSPRPPMPTRSCALCARRGSAGLRFPSSGTQAAMKRLKP